MHASIQPITDAIRRGDNAKAMQLIKQALRVNPNDTDVLLVLAAIVKEATRKRHVLNHILAVAPAHKAAQDMLLEMERTQTSTYGLILNSAPTLKATRAPSIPASKPSPQKTYERLQPTTRLDSPAFTGSKAFKKSFLKQYGTLFALLPMCLLFTWLALASSPETRIVFLVNTAVCALLVFIPFFQVSSIMVEPNRLTVETFFAEKEFGAHEIKEIKMQSVHGRDGRVRNFIYIIPVKGRKYSVSGFSEGEEIVYGFLMNWWNRYQNR
jgi:hypothetical protein